MQEALSLDTGTLFTTQAQSMKHKERLVNTHVNYSYSGGYIMTGKVLVNTDGYDTLYMYK